MVTKEEVQHIGETRGMANHDHDLVHELSKRLDGLWRYDQYIANAEGKQELQNLWQKLKDQDEENVSELKRLIHEEIEQNCF